MSVSTVRTAAGSRAVLLAATVAIVLSLACERTPVSPLLTGLGPVLSKLVSLEIRGTPPVAGASAQLQAIGTFEGGTTLDITNIVQWETSDVSVARVSPTGLLTGVAVGPVYVVARHHTSSGSRGVLISGTGDYAMWISPPGEPLGGGQPGIKRAFFSTASGASFVRLAGENIFAPVNTWARFEFEAPVGQALQLGDYENTTWPAQAGRAGLRLTILGRVCDGTGRFTIRELAFLSNVNGVFVATFRATFEFRCSGQAQTLFGEVNWP